MPSRCPVRFLAPAVLLLIVCLPARAHDGEYIPPFRPPQVTPPRYPPVATGRPLTETPRPVGVPTPGSRTPGPATPTPDSLDRSTAIHWEVAWELLRREILEPPPAAAAETRERAVAALVAALGDENVEVRAEAALALGRLGVYRPVAEAVRRDLELAQTTGLLGPGLAASMAGGANLQPTLEEVYVPILEGEGASVFSRALAAIGLSLGGAGGASRLLGVLEMNGEPTLGPILLFSLGFSGHPGVRDILVDRVIPPAQKGADDPANRALLVAALSFVTGDEIRTDITKRLGDRDLMVQRAAILSLAGDLRSRSTLIALAASGPPGPRSAALLALARAGERKAADAAVRILADPVARGTSIASVAALVLGMLAEHGETLLDVAADPRAETGLRAAAAVGAGLTRERGSGERFAKILAATKDARLAAFLHVGRALVDGEKAVPGIEDLLAREKDATVRRTAVMALGYAGGEKAIDLLSAALGDSYFVNREAAEALYRLAPDRAVNELSAFLADEKDPFARRFGAFALGRVLAPREVSRFTEGILRAGLGFGTGLERLFLHLQSEYLRMILFG